MFETDMIEGVKLLLIKIVFVNIHIKGIPFAVENNYNISMI